MVKSSGWQTETYPLWAHLDHQDGLYSTHSYYQTGSRDAAGNFGAWKSPPKSSDPLSIHPKCTTHQPESLTTKRHTDRLKRKSDLSHDSEHSPKGVAKGNSTLSCGYRKSCQPRFLCVHSRRKNSSKKLFSSIPISVVRFQTQKARRHKQKFLLHWKR